jgi:hypothetical protein
LRKLGVGVVGATLGGLVFAFSPARFFRMAQLHLATVQWVPFTLAYLHAYLEGGRKRDLRLAVAFFSLQSLATGHGAVFALLSVMLLLVYRMALGEPVAPLKRLRDLDVAGALILLPSVLIYLPYRAVQVELGMQRPLGIGAPSPESFLASPTTLHTYLHSFLRAGTHINETANAFLFPGYIPIMLGVIALLFCRSAVPAERFPGSGTVWTRVAFTLEVLTLAALWTAAYITWTHKDIIWRVNGTVLFKARIPLNSWIVAASIVALRIGLLRRAPFNVWPRLRARWLAVRRWGWARRTDARAFYALLTAICVAISVAPPYGLWPYLYRWPGLSLIRAQSRFMILALLGLAVLTGLGFDRLMERRSGRARRLVGLALGLLMVVEFLGIPLPTYPFEVSTNAMERWLDTQPKPFVVAELPRARSQRDQTIYMLHAMTHWQATVQGYSGMEAPLHTELYEQMRFFPDETSLGRLAGLGVTYIVVHRKMYPDDVRAEVDRSLRDFGAWLTLAHEENDERVYALHRPERQ